MNTKGEMTFDQRHPIPTADIVLSSVPWVGCIVFEKARGARFTLYDEVAPLVRDLCERKLVPLATTNTNFQSGDR